MINDVKTLRERKQFVWFSFSLFKKSISMISTVRNIDVLNLVHKNLGFLHDIWENSSRSFLTWPLGCSILFYFLSLLSSKEENTHSMRRYNHPKITACHQKTNHFRFEEYYRFTLINVKAIVGILVASSKPKWRWPTNGKFNFPNRRFSIEAHRYELLESQWICPRCDAIMLEMFIFKYFI